MSTSVSSGLVVRWFLFRGPVATTSILPPLSWGHSVVSAACWTPLIPWMLDDIMNPAFRWTGAYCHLFPKALLSFSHSPAWWSLRQWDLLWLSFQCLFIVKMCFHLRWYLWISCCPWCGWGHLLATPAIPGVAKHTRLYKKGEAQLWYGILQLLCWQLSHSCPEQSSCLFLLQFRLCAPPIADPSPFPAPFGVQYLQRLPQTLSLSTGKHPKL